MRIPKSDYDSDVKPAWLPVVGKDGTPLKPIIRCKCGELAGIGLHHVHADGRVTASFFHPVEGWAKHDTPGCGFHEYLELDDYGGGEHRPGQP
jgi:hypothetical protein